MGSKGRGNGVIVAETLVSLLLFASVALVFRQIRELQDRRKKREREDEWTPSDDDDFGEGNNIYTREVTLAFGDEEWEHRRLRTSSQRLSFADMSPLKSSGTPLRGFKSNVNQNSINDDYSAPLNLPQNGVHGGDTNWNHFEGYGDIQALESISHGEKGLESSQSMKSQLANPDGEISNAGRCVRTKLTSTVFETEPVNSIVGNSTDDLKETEELDPPSSWIGSALKRTADVVWNLHTNDHEDDVSYAGDEQSSSEQDETAMKDAPPAGISPMTRRLPRSVSAPVGGCRGTMSAEQKHVQAVKAHYNSRIMPSKLVMIRHGQSEGNVNETLYATKPDNAMRLTKLGWDQAHMAGKALRESLGGESVHFIVSPYVRTVETFHGLVSAWCDPSDFVHIRDYDQRLKAWYGRLLEMGVTWHEDPRIREQDFGNYQDPVTIKKCKRERHKFGVFYYRFPHGESASDVFDRVSTFLDSLWRSFDSQRSKNYVLVTHGISIRVLLARYFRYSIDQFNMLANPKNGEMVFLGHDGAGKLKLDGRCEQNVTTATNTVVNGTQVQAPVKVEGYTFHKQLRVLPQQWIDKRTIRLSFEEDC
uniref:Uncharacterized protein n=1 Tax=Attheya septentrionalis TaxID=420275 RepID=A0A7S2UN69_9STRA|mmetsp:Transcript_5543/g.9763  ORF Transcript_5543/g.9763 Transcript_5543/m.9763 type:complete len:591 (+) Transcript_5543:229-2001(+)